MRIDAIVGAVGDIQRVSRTVTSRASEGVRFQSALDAAQSTHTVRRGDTLSEIVALRLTQLGQDASARAIYESVARVAAANNIRNPDFIRVGLGIDLGALDAPEAAHVASAPPTAVPRSTPPPRRYSAHVPVPAPSIAPARDNVHAVSVALPPPPAITPPIGIGPNPSAVAEVPAGPVSPQPAVDIHGGSREASAALAAEPRTPATRLWNTVLDGPARLTSEFGPRNDPFNGRRRDHEGIDLAASRGTTVYPLTDGRVRFSGWHRDYGNVVIVAHGDGLETLYGHHERNHVRTGDHVTATTALGAVGSTGRATAPHLHFEVHRAGQAVDPIPFMTSRSPLPSTTPPSS